MSATEEQTVAVPQGVTQDLVELQQAIQQAQSRFNAYLLGAQRALGLDLAEWRLAPDGRHFVRKQQNGD